MALVLASAACGASYQSVYEGDVRFEHCYRLDAEASVSHDAKLACWQDWTKEYTRAQTRDRVEYALSRERALLAGDQRVVGPSILADEGSPVRPVAAVVSGPSIACPLPSSAFEAPPPTLPEVAPAPSVAVSAAATADNLSPSQACVKDCGNSFTTCATKCKKQSCVSKCGDLAKSCIGECL